MLPAVEHILFLKKYKNKSDDGKEKKRKVKKANLLDRRYRLVMPPVETT